MASARVDDDKTGSFHVSAVLPPAGMSSMDSLFCKIDSASHLTPSASLLCDNGVLLKLGHSMEKSRGEPEAPGEPPKPKQGALMKKLSWLIGPKKKASKSSPRKPPSPPSQDCGRDGKDPLELLFAQAEATLGELLVRAGASFRARSSLQGERRPLRHYPQNAQDCAQGSSNGASVKPGSSFGRIDAEAGLGHLRRNSLSRIWQQMGGSFFCGSAHMNTLAMGETELREMAPMLQAPSSTYFGDDADGGDMVADEAYWQSLAESILMQRQKAMEVDQQCVDQLDEAEGAGVRTSMAETSHDFSTTSISTSHCMDIAGSGEVSADCFESEILSVPSGAAAAQDGQEDAPLRCTTCGTSECSLEDKQNDFIVPREAGHGCARLNTTLEASPNLAHSYQLHINSRVDCGAMSSSSSSKNVVELLNYYSRPSPSMSAFDQAMVPILHDGSASSSSGACMSISNSEGPDGPRGNPETNEINSDPLADMASSGACGPPTATDSSAQNEPESVANGIRVSLMALLHEEAAGIVESADAHGVDEHGGQAQALATQDEEGLVGEEPLALYCCVCMVRRKGAALIPCGHTFCRICSKQLFADRGACPLCNNLIVQLLDIF